MGKHTTIEWCSYRNAECVLVPGHTFNPWIGCAHALVGDDEDPACAHCYAEAGTMARVKRSQGLPIWGVDAARHRTSPSYWRQPFRWNIDAKLSRTRPRVFCASLADLFEPRGDLDPWRRELFAMIELCDQLDWLVLTKRPGLAPYLVPSSWTKAWPRHVWFGFSAGTQRAFDLRVHDALHVPAAIHFASLEPLLEPINLGTLHRPLDWVIVGGESGGRARRFEYAWAREILAQCRAAQTPIFVKQVGAWPTYEETIHGFPLYFRDRLVRDRKGGTPSQWPEDLQVREWPSPPLALHQQQSG